MGAEMNNAVKGLIVGVVIGQVVSNAVLSHLQAKTIRVMNETNANLIQRIERLEAQK